MLLMIKANPKPVADSVCLTVGQAFLDAYKKANPGDTITELNLFDMYVPEVDGDMFNAWSALQGGKSIGDLPKEQQKQLNASNAILEQFMKHDKYVFVTPLWNLSYPARLKSYIDALCVAGKTFRYTENGPEGLIKGKKALHIHASGGLHNGACADKHLRDILSFIGIDDMETLIAEGHAYDSNKAEEIISKAKVKAAEVGTRF